MAAVHYARSTLGLLRWSELGLAGGHCPLCRAWRPFLRLRHDEIGVRCLGCRASPITLSMVDVLRGFPLQRLHVYELSARGPLCAFLGRTAARLTTSEYLDGAVAGESRDGVRHEDVQALSFQDQSFDLCTSTEVFEHVPDDRRAMREIRRVLKPGGHLVFTVPLTLEARTIERARLHADGTVEHLEAPEYHIDPSRGGRSILAFRNYGMDIVDRLREAGFEQAEIRMPRPLPWGYQRPVVVAGRR